MNDRPTAGQASHLGRPGGRILLYRVYGDPDGNPVLYCHGFPASSREAAFAHVAATRREIRLIAPDRPGYGGSAPLSYPHVADWAAELEAVVDALRLERFGLLGVSGGAPYAVTAAQHLGERVQRLALVGGLGPLADIRSTAGLSPTARISIWLARHAPAVQSGLFGLLAGTIRNHPGIFFRVMAATMPPCDRLLLRQRKIREIWITALRDGLRQGAATAVDELRRYLRPWGTCWTEQRTVIDLWHGDEDTVVPLSHSRWLAQRLQGAQLHTMRKHGHFSTPVECIDQILQPFQDTSPRRNA